jgi:multidrug transporter EmrE-like cation transporter
MGYLYVAMTIAFTVIGQLLIKHGVKTVGATPALLGQVPLFILRTFTHPLVIIGLGCAVASMACWMLALSRLDLNQAYPFLGLAIVLVLLFSRLLIGEPISLLRWAGVLIVCLGLWMVAQK